MPKPRKKIHTDFVNDFNSVTEWRTMGWPKALNIGNVVNEIRCLRDTWTIEWE